MINELISLPTGLEPAIHFNNTNMMPTTNIMLLFFQNEFTVHITRVLFGGENVTQGLDWLCSQMFLTPFCSYCQLLEPFFLFRSPIATLGPSI